MASTTAAAAAAAAAAAKLSSVHCFHPPSSTGPRFLSTIPKTLFVSAASPYVRRSLSVSAASDASGAALTPATAASSPLRHFASDEPRKGADILVEALEREGVTDVFAYPGGASMEIHQALTRSPSITNHLLRHEQGESFAASGYARSTGRPGVCIATSGPGATNLVSALADALLDSVPMVAITGAG